MRETPEDLAMLQRQLDDSAAAGGAHLRSIFDDEHGLTAAELVELLPGIVEVHLACTTADGAPLVAPIDALVYRGRLWIGLPSQSVRARLVRRDPRVSASYNDERLALIVHGTLVLQGPDDNPDFVAHVKEQYTAQYGDWWVSYFDSLDHTNDTGGYVEPRRIFAKRA